MNQKFSSLKTLSHGRRRGTLVFGCICMSKEKMSAAAVAQVVPRNALFKSFTPQF
ncbi:hypothetical protein [Bradyrhizobium valentinum]|uniref:hypothetical protein n=1 Tax=Bradyrhizobium valentinum TaxID=1518501 RepID=UPI000B16AF71|nr:hypothetical protein [Bradyrhizobium valentinum]